MYAVASAVEPMSYTMFFDAALGGDSAEEERVREEVGDRSVGGGDG